jgi:hypothetical protein
MSQKALSIETIMYWLNLKVFSESSESESNRNRMRHLAIKRRTAPYKSRSTLKQFKFGYFQEIQSVKFKKICHVLGTQSVDKSNTKRLDECGIKRRVQFECRWPKVSNVQTNKQTKENEEMRLPRVSSHPLLCQRVVRRSVESRVETDRN